MAIGEKGTCHCQVGLDLGLLRGSGHCQAVLPFLASLASTVAQPAGSLEPLLLPLMPLLLLLLLLLSLLGGEEHGNAGCKQDDGYA